MLEHSPNCPHLADENLGCDCGVIPTVHHTPVTEDMVTRAINALVYAGYNDETKIKVIRRQASCREYVRAALEAALKN